MNRRHGGQKTRTLVLTADNDMVGFGLLAPRDMRFSSRYPYILAAESRAVFYIIHLLHYLLTHDLMHGNLCMKFCVEKEKDVHSLDNVEIG